MESLALNQGHIQADDSTHTSTYTDTDTGTDWSSTTMATLAPTPTWPETQGSQAGVC